MKNADNTKRGENVEDLRRRAAWIRAALKGGLADLENVRSQAEKRLEQQRKDQTRNQAG